MSEIALFTRGQICNNGAQTNFSPELQPADVTLQFQFKEDASVPIKNLQQTNRTGKKLSSHTCFSRAFFKALLIYFEKRLYSQLE